MALNDAVNRMRGKPGTDITLTILRSNEEKPLQFTITRDVIKINSVRSRTLEPGYGYVRISSFQARTGQDLHTELENLKKENNNSIKGLILDLRNNPGGVLNAAVDVSDIFLDKGLIVYTEGRIKDSELRFNAKPVNVFDKVPMIVLVNEGSASASEIVAGALQDHKRAVIMGQKTFGKGSVQTILPMSNQAAVKLTTALYYTPSGRSIQAAGITPDIIIEKLTVSKIEDDGNGLVKEENLSRHLENTGVIDEPVTTHDPDLQGQEDEADKVPLSSSDYELYEALNVLRGIVLSQKIKG